MGAERQEKYKQQSSALRTSYKTQLEQFYSDHPDAKPPRLSASSRLNFGVVMSVFLTWTHIRVCVGRSEEFESDAFICTLHTPPITSQLLNTVHFSL